MSSYLYTLKRELAWLEHPPGALSVPTSVLSIPSSSPQVKLISGDGYSVSLPLPLLLASSSLLQSTISSYQCCGSTDISIPSVDGRILVLVGEILRRGETSSLAGAQNSGESLKEVQGVMDLLKCGVGVVLKSKGYTEVTRLLENKELGNKSTDNLKITNVSSVNNWGEGCPKLYSSFAYILRTPDKVDQFQSPVDSITPSSSPKQQQIIFKEELDIADDFPDPLSFNDAPVTDETSKSTISKSACPVCNKLVKVKYLNSHIIKVHPESTFTCNICEFKFSNEANFKKHMLRKHKSSESEEKDVYDAESTFPCPICGERFLLKGSLKVHVRLVHGGFNCNACPKNFSTEERFKRHVESAHMKVRFSCSQCEKHFVTKTNADKHCKQEGHCKEGIVKFKLKDGNPSKKKYNTNLDCKGEISISDQSSDPENPETKTEGPGSSKQYICEKCEAVFQTKDGLRLHRQSKHEGVQYSCNQCEFKATQRGNLKAHQEAVHDGIKYSCNLCEYQTTRLSNVRKHKESKHP